MSEIERVELKLKKLETFSEDLELPHYASELASGADLRANLGPGESLEIAPFARVLIPTGLAMEIPRGFEVQIRPRSGLSLKTGLMVVNSPGTIDADYRGEVKIIMGNLSREPVVIRHGERVAQMVLSRVWQCHFTTEDNLGETVRGEGGFGHTGRS